MRCAVFGCNNKYSEKMHRFPECKDAAQKWRESLNLVEFPIEFLRARFGVCSSHFKTEDYEDQEMLLKENAVPQLGTSLTVCENGEGEGVRILAPTYANIALLQPLSTSKKFRTRSMEFSTTSTGGNTDVSILKTHESNYGEDDTDTDDDDDEHACTAPGCRQIHTIDEPDFTIVSCPFEESSEYLKIRLQANKPHSPNDNSGTDSDIEVLMSEELNEAEWSTGMENLEYNALKQRAIKDCSLEAICMLSMEDKIPSSISGLNEEYTSRDYSVKQLSRQSSFNGFDGLSREQLINMVRVQSARIQDLESILKRYRNAQESLCDHVDKLRREFALSAAIETLD